jgi:hypothetical protein
MPGLIFNYKTNAAPKPTKTTVNNQYSEAVFEYTDGVKIIFRKYVEGYTTICSNVDLVLNDDQLSVATPSDDDIIKTNTIIKVTNDDISLL